MRECKGNAPNSDSAEYQKTGTPVPAARCRLEGQMQAGKPPGFEKTEKYESFQNNRYYT